MGIVVEYVEIQDTSKAKEKEDNRKGDKTKRGKKKHLVNIRTLDRPQILFVHQQFLEILEEKMETVFLEYQSDKKKAVFLIEGKRLFF